VLSLDFLFPVFICCLHRHVNKVTVKVYIVVVEIRIK
jgi:hypothetical protein